MKKPKAAPEKIVPKPAENKEQSYSEKMAAKVAERIANPVIRQDE